MRRFLHDNGLTLFFLLILVLALVGQAISGLVAFNDDQAASGGATAGLARYLTSSQFAVDVAENWQSEFLAVAAMAVFSIYLRQRGSPESKPVGEAHGATGIES